VLKAAAEIDAVKQLVLIEPLLTGAACLKQMLGRRKITHAMNGMKIPATVDIDGKTYTDQLGYLISGEDETMLGQWQFSHSLRNKEIYLICTKYTAASQAMLQFCDDLRQHNKVQVEETSLTDFWMFKGEFDYTGITAIFMQLHHSIIQTQQ
jgi:hypothetical protein